ncbi:MAG: hypothetical protein QXW98_04505 [Candidatus Caldarchaeum sp.]
MARRTAIYVKLDEEVLEMIDKLRRTEFGVIDRSEYISRLLRKALGMPEKQEVEQR